MGTLVITIKKIARARAISICDAFVGMPLSRENLLDDHSQCVSTRVKGVNDFCLLDTGSFGMVGSQHRYRWLKHESRVTESDVVKNSKDFNYRSINYSGTQCGMSSKKGDRRTLCFLTFLTGSYSGTNKARINSGVKSISNGC